MKFRVPSWTKPAVLGSIIGAIAISIAGFQAGWVVSKGDALRQAERQANQEVLSALTPICVTQFKQIAQSKKQTHIAALADKGSWDQGTYVENRAGRRCPAASPRTTTLPPHAPKRCLSGRTAKAARCRAGPCFNNNWKIDVRTRHLMSGGFVVSSRRFHGQVRGLDFSASANSGIPN